MLKTLNFNLNYNGTFNNHYWYSNESTKVIYYQNNDFLGQT